jgi:uncharacterized protein
MKLRGKLAIGGTAPSALPFFVLVSVFSLPFYLLGALGPDWTKILPVPLPISVLTIFVPFFAALWLTHREGGLPAIRALLRRIFDIGRIRPPAWLLPAFLLMPSAMFAAYMLQRLLGQQTHASLISLPALAASFAVFFLGAAVEELGWTGYATDLLQRRHSALTAALLLGLFWQAWHIIPLAQAHHPAVWIFWHCLRGVAMRVLMVWLYNNTGKSLFAAIVFHATSNVSDFALDDRGASYNPLVLGLVQWLLVALAIWKYGAQTLSASSRTPSFR